MLFGGPRRSTKMYGINSIPNTIPPDMATPGMLKKNRFPTIPEKYVQAKK
jgi:hypothetical protein